MASLLDLHGRLWRLDPPPGGRDKYGLSGVCFAGLTRMVSALSAAAPGFRETHWRFIPPLTPVDDISIDNPRRRVIASRTFCARQFFSLAIEPRRSLRYWPSGTIKSLKFINTCRCCIAVYLYRLGQLVATLRTHASISDDCA